MRIWMNTLDAFIDRESEVVFSEHPPTSKETDFFREGYIGYVFEYQHSAGPDGIAVAEAFQQRRMIRIARSCAIHDIPKSATFTDTTEKGNNLHLKHFRMAVQDLTFFKVFLNACAHASRTLNKTTEHCPAR